MFKQNCLVFSVLNSGSHLMNAIISPKFSKPFHIELLRFPLVLILVNTVWFLKIPSAYETIYAEDGFVYLSDALNKPIMNGIANTYSGYAGTIGRIGGLFAALFPLKYASIALVFFASLIISLIVLVTYVNTQELLRSKVVRLGLSAAIIFLPIASSESSATVCNLYNFLFFGAFVVMISMKDSRKPGILGFSILLLGALSNPLTVFLLAITLFRYMILKFQNSAFKIAKVEWALALGLLAHTLIVILDTTRETRIPFETSSLDKVGYLFLDRVIGTSLVPGWGLVSGTAGSPGFENSFWLFESLPVRLVIASILYMLFLGYSIWFVKTRQETQTRTEFIPAFVLWHVYIFITGFYYNVEPRYSIFSSLLFLWLLGYLVSNSKLKVEIGKVLPILFFSVVILSSAISQPSQLRISGPVWADELAKAKLICREGGRQSAEIRILPMNSVRLVLVDCSRFKDN
jgi:hypothetical protein